MMSSIVIISEMVPAAPLLQFLTLPSLIPRDYSALRSSDELRGTDGGSHATTGVILFFSQSQLDYPVEVRGCFFPI